MWVYMALHLLYLKLQYTYYINSSTVLIELVELDQQLYKIIKMC